MERPPTTGDGSGGLHSAILGMQQGSRGQTFSGGYRRPEGVSVGEKFFIKLQACGTPTAGQILIYDKTRTFMTTLDPTMKGCYKRLFDVVKAERSTDGRKTYMKASFNEKGVCVAYPNLTSIKAW